MVKIIDLEDNGLTAAQIYELLQSPGATVLRRGGQVVGRLDAMDEIDLDDELWVQAPEQIARGQAARERFQRGEGVTQDELRRRSTGE